MGWVETAPLFDGDGGVYAGALSHVFMMIRILQNSEHLHRGKDKVGYETNQITRRPPAKRRYMNRSNTVRELRRAELSLPNANPAPMSYLDMKPLTGVLS